MAAVSCPSTQVQSHYWGNQFSSPAPVDFKSLLPSPSLPCSSPSQVVQEPKIVIRKPQAQTQPRPEELDQRSWTRGQSITQNNALSVLGEEGWRGSQKETPELCLESIEEKVKGLWEEKNAGLFMTRFAKRENERGTLFQPGV